MKADKILFGAACFAMGLMTYSAMNRGCSESFLEQTRVCAKDTPKLKPGLLKDTICFSNADTLKIARQITRR